MQLTLKTAEVFLPLLMAARYKGVYGGRGSGKSHFLAEMLVEECLLVPGTRAVCIREVQKTLKESSKRLIEDKIQAMGVGHLFDVRGDFIRTPGDGLIVFTGMQDANAESIKSLERIRIAWIEEAQTISDRSLMLLRPTIRMEGSEIWFSWNARRKTDPVDVLLRGDKVPSSTVVIACNWRDNPHFPDVLNQERLDCLRMDPDQYGHIWEGEYATLLVGAYYANSITVARQQHRIGKVAPDPLLPYLLFVDIGGTGAKADAFTIWVAQSVGKEIRVLNYYEVVGQPLSAHLSWLRENGYSERNTRCYLPHDGNTHDKVYDVTYSGAMQDAGYNVTVIPNQGKGAAIKRVEAGRRMFQTMWFNEETTAAGIDALGWYHEKRDEVRKIGLGPNHDWASHGADAFGLMAVVLEVEQKSTQWRGEIDYSKIDKGRY